MGFGVDLCMEVLLLCNSVGKRKKNILSLSQKVMIYVMVVTVLWYCHAPQSLF